jgi:hypothetical protein
MVEIGLYGEGEVRERKAVEYDKKRKKRKGKCVASTCFGASALAMQ